MGKIATDDLRSRVIAKSQSKDESASVMSNQAELVKTSPTPNVPKAPDTESSRYDAKLEMISAPVEATSEKGEELSPTVETETNQVIEKRKHDFDLDRAEAVGADTFPNPPAEGKKAAATIPNIKHLLSQYGIILRYNVVKKTPEIIVPGLFSSLDNADNVAMAHIKSLSRLNGISVTGLEETLLAIADQNQYSPIANWITSKPWDGVDRLPEFYNTLQEREDFPPHLKEILMKRWMVSGIASVMKSIGFKARGVLTIQGNQGIGKTSWIAALVPDPVLRESAIKLDHHLDAGNKDSQIAAATHWIVEIGELESSFRRDVARLKGFITSDCDKIRLPYARTASTFLRRTVFAATVNDSRFLVDSTGNTRWWTIPVTSINYQHQLEMQQIWAQFLVEYENGEQWWLTTEEEDLLEALNQDHRVVSVIEERVLPILDLNRKNEDGLPAMTPTELLMKLGIKYVSNAQAKECGSILRHHLGEPKKIKGIMKWRVPIAKQPDFTEIDEY